MIFSFFKDLFVSQVLGKVPTISINKTEGCHVYLSKDSLDCEIVSAKSSEMNILVPDGEDDYVSVYIYLRHFTPTTILTFYLNKEPT